MTKKDIKEIEELKQKIEELENKYKRVLADYQNLEKRVAQEKKEWIHMANKELILRLLPVLDTLMLASIHVQDEGLRLSIQQFLDVLKNEGVERIETRDERFNPETMECVETGKGEEGKILEEIRAGYLLHGRTLRVALVKVGKEKIEKREEEEAKEELQKGDYM